MPLHMESNLFSLLFCKTLLTRRAIQELPFDLTYIRSSPYYNGIPCLSHRLMSKFCPFIPKESVPVVCPKGVSFGINGVFLISINLTPKHKRHKFPHRKPNQIPASMHTQLLQPHAPFRETDSLRRTAQVVERAQGRVSS